MLNLSSGLRYQAKRDPDRLALVYGDAAVAYGDLVQRIDGMAAFLHGRGIGKGDVVGAFMKNSLAFVELGMAVSDLGAILLPMNYRLAAEEAAYIHGDGEVRILFADEEFAPVVGRLPNIVWLDEAAQADSRRLGGAGADDRRLGGAGEPPPRAEVGRDDLHRLMYTSGTTDRPKGVTHSYQNHYWKWIEHVTSWDLGRDSRALIVGPMYHVAGWDAPGPNLLMLGGMYVLHREFDAERTLADIQTHRVTCLWLAPVMLGQILALPNREDYDISSVELVLGGGEKTPEGRIRAFDAFFTAARYADGYGMTESNAFDTVMPPGMEIAKIGSAGAPTAHTDVRILDDDGNALPPGEEGEICMRGEKITKGYWNDAEKTAATFHGDWLRSGDVGYLDADDFLFITDRKKDMIISGAENIASSEVERVLFQMSEIADVAVIGVADEKWGEKPVAIVVPAPGAALDYQALEAFCRQHLAGYKVPKEMIVMEELPRNPSGKVLKRVLREQFANPARPAGDASA